MGTAFLAPRNLKDVSFDFLALYDVFLGMAYFSQFDPVFRMLVPPHLKSGLKRADSPCAKAA